MHPKRILPLLLLALSIAVVPALASEPSSGTVSLAAPDAKWQGVAQGYGVFPANLLLISGGAEPQCPPQACDTYNLTVADQADLTIFAASRTAEQFTELHVIDPAGSMRYVQSAQGSAATVKLKNAAKGEYTIEVLTNDAAIAAGEYDASARLGGAAAKPAPGGPAPAVTPGPAAPAPAPAPAPAATLTLRTAKLSARKARKSAKLKIATTSPVTGLVATLAKGKKVVGKAKLAKLEKSGTIAFKLSKTLKPGTYTVALSAKDGAGNTVGLRAKLKVTR